MARGRPCDDAGDTDPLDLDAEDCRADGRADGGVDGGADRGGRGGGGSGLVRWPQGVPAWVRGPAAVVVLVVVAAGAGAVAGSSHRVALDQEVALQRALTVSDAFVATRGSGGGALSAEVQVALVNHDDAAVEVRLQGLSTPHQGTASPPEEVRVQPGDVTSAPVAVRVDCDAVREDLGAPVEVGRTGELVVVDPATGATAAAGAAAVSARAVPTVVLASVRREAGGSAVDVQLPVVGAIADSIDSQLAAQCGTAERPLLETGWLWQDDGGLRVSVAARPDAAPVRLVLDSTAGLEATSDPPLPRELLPGETAVLDLQVRPRCRVVGDGALSRLDLQAVTGNGATTSLGQGFDATTRVAGTPQWLARRVALACG